jgi:8-oxo-dGTP diphosphatase
MLQVGVKVLLQNTEGKYLLLRRSSEKYPDVAGRWDIVGGRIQPGTPLIENLQREVQEETGLELAGTPELIAAQDILRSVGRHTVRLTYLGKAKGEVALDKSENDEYRWLSFEEMRTMDDVDVYFRELLDNRSLRSRSGV